MIADRMSGVDMSGIRKMFEMAGKDAINLGIGEPDFQPPAFIIDAYVQALREGQNNYGPSSGIMPLREAIAEKERHRLPDITASHVIVTAGSTNALYGIMQAFVNPGDQVLCPDPGFVLYGSHVRLANGVPVYYPLSKDNAFVPDVDDMRDLITNRTRAIVVNSPSNPCGTTIPQKTVKAICDLAAEHDLIVISDEAYDSITYDEPHTSFLGKYENVVYCNTFSKTYAMTGWRIGYMIARPELGDALKKINYHLIANPPTPTQYACLAALKGPQDFVKEMVLTFKERRDLIVKMIDEIPGFEMVTPKGAFYAYPHYSQSIDCRDLAMRFLKAGVVTVPGDAFGTRGAKHIRISYGNSTENIEKGLTIMRKVVEGLPR
ncbi:MAG TPA: pyridoxal phosphate-dependent aminotransferase [Candidatus Thermoplasmatota archaeon]|nr:pyridoxal phosphate-dependent aminotransferase [Candidatus Thermoplasmatota archaeon]